METYGKELILDLYECNPDLFNRETLTKFFDELCDLIDMQKEDLHFWDDLDTPEEEKETAPHLKGTSAIQFIKTSNVTIHTLDILKRVYLNIFSCKDFDVCVASKFCEDFFESKLVKQARILERI